MSMDPFSAEIVALVRRMSDDAILALVRDQLTAVSGLGVARSALSVTKSKNQSLEGNKLASTKAASNAANHTGAPRSAPKRTRRRRVDSAEREQLLASVERIVKGGAGMSASEVARVSNTPQARVAAALKELKHAKRVFQGGDRRFARYAADSKTAEQASLAARENAAGPVRLAAGRAKKK